MSRRRWRASFPEEHDTNCATCHRYVYLFIHEAADGTLSNRYMECEWCGAPFTQEWFAKQIEIKKEMLDWMAAEPLE